MNASIVYVGIDIKFSVEQFEKIEFMKINKLIKLHLRRFNKRKELIQSVVQSNNLIRFYAPTDKKLMRKNKYLS